MYSAVEIPCAYQILPLIKVESYWSRLCQRWIHDYHSRGFAFRITTPWSGYQTVFIYGEF